ncbi:MAG: undecaprenyldiphospho-muramoylpentapeptide beta-N-acetylglucosaminyltransferase [Alphaproteobacteria bacterium CG11_big_fil_rev_8_21_14_0_20_39_49]|nr:MAG: undecaprenyldiphospho-muramoylpentapeptide beta-N-acetylglucosaminyltransferase [Alphaproteobacteria bacterium CG11_big_fil_rev_8_21_14_0_20_39_49]
MSENDKNKIVVLAAGGTGGHIFPAEALASELIEQGHKAILISDKRYKKHLLTPEKMEVRVISAASTGGGIAAKLKAVPMIFAGIRQAKIELKRIKPDVVVGFGGYPSFPTMFAANILKIKTVIHEQNCVMGKVNRFLCGKVTKIATSFREVKGISEKYYDKVVLTGNPVRPAIKALREIPYPDPDDGETIHILVTGGSQGASIFSEVVPQAVCNLPEELRHKIRIDQQCRHEDLDRVKKIYDEAGISADLATFFEDIPARISSSHLIIARAGASTVSEITVAGRPSILVPYKFATDDHQTVNAMALAKKEAAILISQDDFTQEELSKTLKSLLSNPEKLISMAKNSYSMGKTDAVEKLMDCL